MRRALFWQVPLTIALVATAIFAAGFYAFLTGDTGTAVGPTVPRLKAQAPPRSTVVPLILGDSLARGIGDQSGLGIGGRLAAELKRIRVEGKPAVNLALNGARTPDLLRQLESRNVRTLIAQSNVIIISIGGNDLRGDAYEQARSQWPKAAGSMHAVLERIAEIVGIVRRENPSARILVVGLYNPFGNLPFGPAFGALVTKWNAMLMERFATDANVTIVPTADLFSHHKRLSLDDFHPNEEGYELITRRIADSL